MKRVGMIAMLLVLGGVAQAKEAATTCNGELLKHPAKVQVCVPSGWMHEVKEGILRIKNQKEWTVQIRLEAVEAADLKGAVSKLETKISDFATVTWGKPKEIKKTDKDNPNHMDGMVLAGNGKRKDNNGDVNVLAAIVSTPSGQMLLVSLIGDKAYLDKEGASVVHILDTIQPAE